MKKTLKKRILDYILNQGDWVNGKRIEELALSAGYKGSTASHELRRLADDGDIQRELRKGRRVKSVWYKAGEPRKIQRYYVPGLGKEIVSKEY